MSQRVRAKWLGIATGLLAAITQTGCQTTTARRPVPPPPATANRQLAPGQRPSAIAPANYVQVAPESGAECSH